MQKEADVVGRLLSQSLSGLIIAPVAAEHAYLEPWKDRLPIVFVDRRPVRLAADSFTEDDHGGALMATRHLVEHGHRRIAFVSDTPDLPTSHSRLLGYRAALTEAGIGEDPDYEVHGAVDRGSAAGALRKLMELAEPPTAIMSSYNARSSMALVPALREHGLAIVGFGDFPMADMLDPAITVIDQDPYCAVARSPRNACSTGSGTRVRRYRRRTVLPVALVERASCQERPWTTVASSRSRGRALVVSRSLAGLVGHREAVLPQRRPAMAPPAPLATAIPTC